MFAHHCTVCGVRRLVFPSQVHAMSNTSAGIEVAFACWCGAEQEILTGRRAEQTYAAA